MYEGIMRTLYQKVISWTKNGQFLEETILCSGSFDLLENKGFVTSDTGARCTSRQWLLLSSMSALPLPELATRYYQIVFLCFIILTKTVKRLISRYYLSSGDTKCGFSYIISFLIFVLLSKTAFPFTQSL